eukprot:gene2991-584_t
MRAACTDLPYTAVRSRAQTRPPAAWNCFIRSNRCLLLLHLDGLDTLIQQVPRALGDAFGEPRNPSRPAAPPVAAPFAAAGTAYLCEASFFGPPGPCPHAVPDSPSLCTLAVWQASGAPPAPSVSRACATRYGTRFVLGACGGLRWGFAASFGHLRAVPAPNPLCLLYPVLGSLWLGGPSCARGPVASPVPGRVSVRSGGVPVGRGAAWGASVGIFVRCFARLQHTPVAWSPGFVGVPRCCRVACGCPAGPNHRAAPSLRSPCGAASAGSPPTVRVGFVCVCGDPCGRLGPPRSAPAWPAPCASLHPKHARGTLPGPSHAGVGPSSRLLVQLKAESAPVHCLDYLGM